MYFVGLHYNICIIMHTMENAKNYYYVIWMEVELSIYVYIISEQMHCSDRLLISHSSYMFRRMYVIFRELPFVCPVELH
jgi:hypothetical protein